MNGATCRPGPHNDNTIWVQVFKPHPIKGGCDCSYCKSHPTLTPCWDTLVVPINYEHRPEARAHTIHAPEFWD